MDRNKEISEEYKAAQKKKQAMLDCQSFNDTSYIEHHIPSDEQIISQYCGRGFDE